MAPLVATGAAYALGVYRLARRSRRGRAVGRRSVVSFAAGWVTLAAALASPLHELGERLFSAHMAQHELLMVVAAPLLVVGRPLAPMVWALPRRWRRGATAWSRSRAWRAVWGVASAPWAAWTCYAVVFWLWHVPRAYEAALGSEWVHALEHASFLGAALLFWWSVLPGAGGRGRGREGVGVLSLFTTAVHSSILGALLTFSAAPWYPVYEGGGAGVAGALADQQLAGLVMWVPAGASYVIVALWLAARWMRESDARAARSELTFARIVER
ncbi:MAG TPA: cytochrome c oxidase assembly protein [Gemmatimonadaceae bacterium]